MIESSGIYFTENIEGNHFFFIGSVGARTTVEKIRRLYARVKSIPFHRRKTAEIGIKNELWYSCGTIRTKVELIGVLNLLIG